jgi:hypothetical protein
MRWTGHAAQIVWKKKAYRLMVGKIEGKRILRGPRHRWVDNIKMDIRVKDGVIWTGFMWLRMVTGGGLLCTRQ